MFSDGCFICYGLTYFIAWMICKIILSFWASLADTKCMCRQQRIGYWKSQAVSLFPSLLWSCHAYSTLPILLRPSGPEGCKQEVVPLTTRLQFLVVRQSFWLSMLPQSQPIRWREWGQFMNNCLSAVSGFSKLTWWKRWFLTVLRSLLVHWTTGALF